VQGLLACERAGRASGRLRVVFGAMPLVMPGGSAGCPAAGGEGRGRRSLAVPVLLGAALMLGGCDASSESPSQPSAAPTVAGLAWRQLAGVPSPRTEVAAAAAGSRIYVVGGFTADGTTVVTVEAFDTATGRWERGPDLPVAVNHAMAASVSETVYVFGGHRPDHAPSAAAFRLEPDGWRPIADLPEGRAAGTAVAAAGKVYLAGGLAGTNRLADRMLVYDPAADRWTAAPGPPTPREHLAGAAQAGRVYTAGGRTAATGNLATVEVYEPTANRWTALPDLPTPRGGSPQPRPAPAWSSRPAGRPPAVAAPPPSPRSRRSTRHHRFPAALTGFTAR